MYTHIPELPNVKLRTETYEGSRFYLAPNGMWYPSVTTVTGHKSRNFFAEWSKKPENRKKSAFAASRGTSLHSLAEDHLQNKEVKTADADPSAVRMYTELIPYLHKINNIRAQETTLWSSSLRIAGRLDLLSDYAGIPSIVDFKTSFKLKEEYQIQNYFEQCTIYSVAWKQMTQQKIKQIVVLIATENDGVQEFVRNPVDYAPGVHKTIQNFWKDYDFNHIQDTLNAITVDSNSK